jgi:hypothetical protein
VRRKAPGEAISRRPLDRVVNCSLCAPSWGVGEADYGKLDFDRFLLNPGSSFERPEDVIGDPRLGRQQKIEILCRWVYDATELAVAEEEGMNGGEASNLHGVLNALVSITGGFDAEHTGPTKHAGFCIL